MSRRCTLYISSLQLRKNIQKIFCDQQINCTGTRVPTTTLKFIFFRLVFRGNTSFNSTYFFPSLSVASKNIISLIRLVFRGNTLNNLQYFSFRNPTIPIRLVFDNTHSIKRRIFLKRFHLRQIQVTFGSPSYLTCVAR